MPEEPTASAPTTAEPPQTPATSPDAAKPQESPATPKSEAPNADPKSEAKPKPEFDYRAAWIATQSTVRRLHEGYETSKRQNAELVQSLKDVRETTNLLAQQNLGPEQAQALRAQQAQSAERAAALRAAQDTQRFVEVQSGLFLDTLKAAGIDPADPEIDWARDSRDVQEWSERVGPSITKKMEKVIAQRISQAEEGIRARSAAEIRAEAEALTARAVKEAGIDKVDTGSGTTSTGKTVAEMSDEEFKQYREAKFRAIEQRRTQSYR